MRFSLGGDAQQDASHLVHRIRFVVADHGDDGHGGTQAIDDGGRLDPALSGRAVDSDGVVGAVFRAADLDHQAQKLFVAQRVAEVDLDVRVFVLIDHRVVVGELADLNSEALGRAGVVVGDVDVRGCRQAAVIDALQGLLVLVGGRGPVLDLDVLLAVRVHVFQAVDVDQLLAVPVAIDARAPEGERDRVGGHPARPAQLHRVAGILRHRRGHGHLQVPPWVSLEIDPVEGPPPLPLLHERSDGRHLQQTVVLLAGSGGEHRRHRVHPAVAVVDAIGGARVVQRKRPAVVGVGQVLSSRQRAAAFGGAVVFATGHDLAGVTQATAALLGGFVPPVAVPGAVVEVVVVVRHLVAVQPVDGDAVAGRAGRAVGVGVAAPHPGVGPRVVAAVAAEQGDRPGVALQLRMAAAARQGLHGIVVRRK